MMKDKKLVFTTIALIISFALNAGFAVFLTRNLQTPRDIKKAEILQITLLLQTALPANASRINIMRDILAINRFFIAYAQKSAHKIVGNVLVFPLTIC